MDIPESLIYDRAGGITFERGREYFDQGLVRQLRVHSNTVTAQVDGTEVYHVTLETGLESLEGRCDCPAYDKWGFCKHCVAVALACTGNTVQEQDSDLNTVFEYLQQNLSKKQLVEILNGYIAEDPIALAKWKLKAELKSGKGADAKSLRKQITKALPYREIWDYHAVGQYFQQAESTLESIVESIKTLPAEQQVSLCAYAYDRLNKALHGIDDSNGDRYYLIGILEPIFSAAFTQCNWTQNQKFKYLLNALLTGDDVFPEIPCKFIPDAQTDEFYKALELYWLNLETPANQNSESYWPYMRIARMLEDHYEDRGDHQGRINILSRYAHEAYELERLCKLYLRLKQTDNALSCINQIQKIEFQDTNRFAVKNADSLMVQLLQDTAQYEAALQLKWECFHTADSPSNYQHLLELTKLAGGRVEDCYTRAEQHFISIMVRNDHSCSRPSNRKLIDFYCYTQSLAKACEIADTQKVASDQLLELATQVINSTPERGFNYLERVILLEAQQTGNRNYDYVANLLTQLQAFLEKQASAKLELRFTQLVDSLRQAYKRRPNFIKRLEQFKTN